MTSVGRHARRAGALLILLVLASMPAFAAWNDVVKQVSSAMGLAWSLIGALFTFDTITRSALLREGILKFLIFILILRVVQVSLSRKGDHGDPKPFDRKTAGIVGFVVAAITVLFTPNTFLFAGVVALLVPIMLIGYMAWQGMALKDSCPKHWIGVLVLFLTILVSNFTADMFRSWNPFKPAFLQPFVFSLLSVVAGLVAILFVIKLIMAIICSLGGGSGAGALGAAASNTSAGGTTAGAAGDTAAGARREPEGGNSSTDGVLRIQVVEIHADGNAHPGSDARVWMTTTDGAVVNHPVHAQHDGRAQLTIRQLPNNGVHLIVHASKDGFRAGTHLDAAHGGRPAGPVELSPEHAQVDVVVPLVSRDTPIPYGTLANHLRGDLGYVVDFQRSYAHYVAFFRHHGDAYSVPREFERIQHTISDMTRRHRHLMHDLEELGRQIQHHTPGDPAVHHLHDAYQDGEQAQNSIDQLNVIFERHVRERWHDPAHVPADHAATAVLDHLRHAHDSFTSMLERLNGRNGVLRHIAAH